jgi:hypothetical protein
MTYEVKTGPIPAVRDHRKPRGTKPTYPLADMEFGQWIAVPFAEQYRLFKAIKNAKYNNGIYVQTQLSADGKFWIVMRVPKDVLSR